MSNECKQPSALRIVPLGEAAKSLAIAPLHRCGCGQPPEPPVPPPEPPNQPPLVDAGAGHDDAPEAVFYLAGEAHDPDDGPEPLTVAWSLVSGPGTAVFADVHAAQTSVTVSQAGEYVFRLTASDGLATVSDTVTVRWKMQLGVFNDSVCDAAADAQGRVVLVGAFTKYTKGGVDYPCAQVCRLDSFGNFDEDFTANCKLGASGMSYPYFKRVFIQPDGKILAALPCKYRDPRQSYRVTWNGEYYPSCIVRLNTDGTLDPSYAEDFTAPFVYPYKNDGTSYAELRDVSMLPDGSLVATGYADVGFYSTGATYSGVSMARILRPDGTMRPDFAAYFGYNNTNEGRQVSARYLGSRDGKLYVAFWDATHYNDVELPHIYNPAGTSYYSRRSWVARLNANGTLDETYALGPDYQFLNQSVMSMGECTLLPDGSVLMYYHRSNGTGVYQLRLDSAGGAEELAVGSQQMLRYQGRALGDGWTYFRWMNSSYRYLLVRRKDGVTDFDTTAHIISGTLGFYQDNSGVPGVIRYGGGYLVFGSLNASVAPRGTANFTNTYLALFDADWEPQS